MESTLPEKAKGFSLGQVILIAFLVLLLTAGIVSWVFLSDVFATRFEPVELAADEQKVLDEKLNRIGIDVDSGPATANATGSKPALEPEAYRERDEDREVRFSEREVNALLAHNTELADKLAIDLSGDLVSAKLLIPLDEELPVLGGKTLKVTAGIEFLYNNDRPAVVVKGISVWGVPVPSSYLGDIKNVDLVEQYGDQGFWKQFADGLDNIRVDEGEIYLKFKP